MERTPQNPSPSPASARIDKWLWAVRLFKTRSLAMQACRGGHVTIAGAAVKPSREIRAGETIAVLAGEVHRTVKVIAPIDQRVGPKLVDRAMEDLTPAEEFLRALKARQQPAAPRRPKGAGRPTKKERRAIERLAGES